MEPDDHTYSSPERRAAQRGTERQGEKERGKKDKKQKKKKELRRRSDPAAETRRVAVRKDSERIWREHRDSLKSSKGESTKQLCGLALLLSLKVLLGKQSEYNLKTKNICVYSYFCIKFDRSLFIIWDAVKDR